MRSSSSRRASSSSRSAEPVLLQLVEDVAAAGEIAHQHALAIAHQFGLDVLVRRGILEHGAHVHAALMRKRAVADERLIVAQRQVRQFRDEARTPSQAGQFLRTDGGVPELQFQIGDDRRQIGVAAALAVAVHAALHVRAPCLHRGERIRHRHVGIVMRVDADARRRSASARRRTISDQPAGQRAAVGVAEAEHVGAGALARLPASAARSPDWLCSRRRNARRRRPLPCRAPSGTRTVSEISCRFSSSRDAERPVHMQVPGLAEDRHHRRAGFHQRRAHSVLFDRVLGEARGAERRQLRVLQVELRGARAKKSLSLGLDPGQPPSM